MNRTNLCSCTLNCECSIRCVMFFFEFLMLTRRRFVVGQPIGVIRCVVGDPANTVLIVGKLVLGDSRNDPRPKTKIPISFFPSSLVCRIVAYQVRGTRHKKTNNFVSALQQTRGNTRYSYLSFDPSIPRVT